MRKPDPPPHHHQEFQIWPGRARDFSSFLPLLLHVRPPSSFCPAGFPPIVAAKVDISFLWPPLPDLAGGYRAFPETIATVEIKDGVELPRRAIHLVVR